MNNTIQSVSTNYKYEAIDKTSELTEEKVQGTATQTVETESKESDIKGADTKVAGVKQSQINFECLENQLGSIEYRQKLMDKMASVNLSDEKYIEMAVSLKKTIENIVDKVTEEDIKGIIRENYNPEKISMEMFSKIIDQNKLAIRKQDIEKIQSDIDIQVEAFKRKFEDFTYLKETITELKSQSLPVTKKNIEKVQDVLVKLEEIRTLTDSTMVQIVKLKEQNKELTIENVYKAKYVTSSEKAITVDLSALEPQIELALKKAKLTTKDNMELAKRLIHEGIALDEETLSVVKEVKEAVKTLKPQEVIEKAGDLMVKKQSAAAVPLLTKEPSPEVNVDREQLEQTIEKISLVDIKHIENVVRQNKEINLKNIFNEYVLEATEEPTDVPVKAAINEPIKVPMKEATTVPPKAPLEPMKELKVIQASLQIEEIRLKMTIEAASKLAHKGIEIDTLPIEKVVEGLRTLEKEAYKKHLYYQDVPRTDENISKVENCMQKVSQLNYITSQAIVKIANKEIDFTISAVADETTKELAVEHALKSYDILSTKPRRDMGDSIEKAFVQIKDILKDLNLEPTKENEKAVQIIAKSEMPITVENIETIKLIQQKIEIVTEKLHPSIVVSMIKDQLSPVDLHVDEVLQYVQDFDILLGETDQEKIAREILELDQKNELKPEERESLVGIYRMFSAIAKSKGQVAGFLVKNNMELNLNNLFEAAKFIGKTKGNKNAIEVDVDDDFGLLKSLKYEGKTIKEQINTALNESGLPNMKSSHDLTEGLETSGVEISNETLIKGTLHKTMLERFIDKIDVGQIHKFQQEGLLDNPLTSIDQLLERLTTDAKEDINQTKQTEEEIVKTLKEFVHLDVETLKKLEQYGLDKNITTMKALKDLVDHPFELTTKLEHLIEKLDLEEIVRVSEVVKLLQSDEEPFEAYDEKLSELKNQLARAKEELLEMDSPLKNTLVKEIDQTVKLVDYQRAIHKQEDYYQIPLLINGKMSQLNMYYINDDTNNNNKDEDKMKIHLYFKTENLGSIQAYMNINGRKMDFGINTSNMEDLAIIKEFESAMKDIFVKSEYQVSSINYGSFEGKSPISEEIKTTKPDKVRKNSQTKFEVAI